MSARLRSALAAFALAASSGCYLRGADGPHFADYDAVEPGRARLYVYRPSHPQGAWVAVKVRLDGDALVRLRDSGYGSLTLPPGDYELEAAWPLLFFDASRTAGRVRLRAGEATFCRYGRIPNLTRTVYRWTCGTDPERSYDLGGCKREPLQPGWEP